MALQIPSATPDLEPERKDSAYVDELVQVIEAKVPTRVEELESTELDELARSTVEAPQRIGKIPFSREGRTPAPPIPHDSGHAALHGHCNICGWQGRFQSPERGREGQFCGNCASTSRHRMVVYGLSMVMKLDGKLPSDGSIPLHAWPGDHHLHILEPSGRGSYPMMLADRYDYQGIEYDPDKVDSEHPHKGYGDLQRLHYDDESYDLVIASDVFEHVRDDDAGFAEIRRVLKSDGALVLTVPYEHHQERTVQRVDTHGEEDVHLLLPVYHSGGGQTLVYRDYGRDLLTKLRGMGFTVIHVDQGMEQLGITRQSLILAFKKDFVEWIPTDAGSNSESQTFYVGPLLPQRLYLLLKFNLLAWKQQLTQLLRR